MHMPDHHEFAAPPHDAAIYICADCAIEHNGDTRTLPQGWDRVIDPKNRQTTVRCPDCLEAIEREFAEAISALGYNDHWSMRQSHVGRIGLTAAAYRGGLSC